MLHSLRRPELAEQPGMVYEIWEDGEITLTKSGDLYRQRSLHTIVPGIPDLNVPLPVQGVKGHSSMVVDPEDIPIARALILGDIQDPYAFCLPGKKYASQEELYIEINRRNELYANT